MASATLEFTTWAIVEYITINPELAIDGDDGTRAEIRDRTNDGSSVAYAGLSVPADYGSADSAEIDLLWRFAGPPGRTIQYARVYSREATSGGWTLRYNGSGLLPGYTVLDDILVSIPITNPEALQVLVETYTATGGGGDPPPPPDFVWEP